MQQSIELRNNGNIEKADEYRNKYINRMAHVIEKTAPLMDKTVYYIILEYLDTKDPNRKGLRKMDLPPLLNDVLDKANISPKARQKLSVDVIGDSVYPVNRGYIDIKPIYTMGRGEINYPDAKKLTIDRQPINPERDKELIYTSQKFIAPDGQINMVVMDARREYVRYPSIQPLPGYRSLFKR